MATIAGKHGDITAANVDAFAHSWSIDFATDALEDTNWDGSGAGETDEYYRTFIGGLTGWSGSWECYADATPAATLVPGQSEVAVKFYVDEANTKGYSGSVIVTGVHPSASVDGIETITFDFQGTGKPSFGDIG